MDLSSSSFSFSLSCLPSRSSWRSLISTSVLAADAPLGLAPHHHAVYVMQENQRNEVLVAIHDEAGGLVGALRIDHASKLHALFTRVTGLRLGRLLVGDNAHGHASDTRISANQGATVIRTVFIKLAAVYNASDDLMHVVAVRCRPCRVGIKQTIQVAARVLRRILLRIERSTVKGSTLALADL